MFESPRAAAASRLAAAILWGVCAWGLPGAASAVQWTRVLGSGDLAPGFENGTQVDFIGAVAPRLADDGELIFTASMGKAGVPFLTVLYRHSAAGSFDRVALASPGPFGGDGFAQFTGLESNGRGDALVFGLRPIAPIPCGDAGIQSQREVAVVYGRDGGDRVVAESFLPVSGADREWVDRVGLCMPGSQQCLLGDPPRPLLGEAGGVALTANTATDACTDRPAISAFGPDGAAGEQLAVLAGDPVPGAPEGVAFGSRLDWVRGSLNASGQIAVRAALDDGSDALYRWDPGLGLTLLARTGEASAIAGGALFLNLGAAALDANGVPAFFATDAAAPAGAVGFVGATPPMNGLWAADGAGGVRLLASVGAEAPGAPDGSVFASFDRPPTVFPFRSPFIPPPFVDAGGEVAVALPVDVPGLGVVPAVFGSDEDGVFTMRMLGLGPAPGAADMRLGVLEVIGLSEDRRILVRARIHPDGQPEQTELAWYLLEPTGAERLLLRASDPLELVPGEFEPVEDFLVSSLHANADLSAFAALAFRRSLPAASALFVAQVPEPGSLASSGVAVSALGWVTHRRRRLRLRS